MVIKKKKCVSCYRTATVICVHVICEHKITHRIYFPQNPHESDNPPQDKEVVLTLILLWEFDSINMFSKNAKHVHTWPIA